jgi:flagellar hook-associated protein 3 FlgL
MRIADKMNYTQVKDNVAKNRSEMSELHNQAATQKRVTKPSDDPLASTRILATRSDISSGQQFMKNIQVAKGFLEFSEQTLGELGETLMRAKELAISQANDASGNERTREITATEVEQLHGQSVQIANRKLGDRFLFGGFRTTRPPFDPDGNYYGDNGEIKIAIDKEASIAMNIPGSAVFLGINPKAEPQPGPTQRPPHKKSDEHIEGRGDLRSQPMRGPASETQPGTNISADRSKTDYVSNLSSSWESGGTSVFQALKDLEIGLRANDKGSIQESLDVIDSALAQVVLMRAQIGSRVSTVNATLDTLQKGQVDNKTIASNLEEVDTFALVSDINKTESTLQATLQTSGKLVQPSLLDFLR